VTRVLPPLYFSAFAAPHRRRARLGRWAWSITDGLTGPELVSGTARTEWGCLVRLGRALQRCKSLRPPAVTDAKKSGQP
jgi:hypothetical protein